MDNLGRYRWVFVSAAIYNLAWAIFVVLFPNAYFDLFQIPRPIYPGLWQCIGMMVGTFALGYWLIARDPRRYGAFAWIGLIGKVLGPLGLVNEIATGGLPLKFAWVCVTNDVIWWIPFAMFIKEHLRSERAQS